MFKTYVFLDFETTGLVNPVVTEMALVAIDADCTRTVDKLVMCFDPIVAISPKASELTGLTNAMLASRKTFSDVGVKMLNAFVEAQKLPACLVAHNGDDFDFEILAKTPGIRLPIEVFTVDTLHLFREMVKCRSYKLINVYNHLFGRMPAVSHGAEADCETLRECFMNLRCIEYVNRNFDKVQPYSQKSE